MQCWENDQYSIKKTLEIVGLPKSLSNGKAKRTCVKFFKILTAMSIKKIWMLVNRKDKEPVIVRFCQKKDCEKVLKAKKNLRKFNATNVDLPEGSKIFVNQSLCSYYCFLWSTSKKIHVKGRSLIGTFQTYN